MLPIIILIHMIGQVCAQCENSKAVKLGEMLQDVLDLNSTVQALVEIIYKQVTSQPIISDLYFALTLLFLSYTLPTDKTIHNRILSKVCCDVFTCGIRNTWMNQRNILLWIAVRSIFNNRKPGLFIMFPKIIIQHSFLLRIFKNFLQCIVRYCFSRPIKNLLLRPLFLYIWLSM